MRARLTLLHLLCCLLTVPATVSVAQTTQISDADLEKLFDVLANGESYKVRLHAAKVLGMLGRDKAIPHLVKALRKDPDQLVRSTAAWALGALNNPGSIRDLDAAASNEVPMVSKRARRALDHILASFPENMPAKGNAILHFDVDDLVDKVNKDKELTVWVQQYFAEKLLLHADVDIGSGMDIEEDGINPDKVADALPVVGFSLRGGVEKVDVPAGRAKGKVTVTLNWEVHLDPPGRKVTGAKHTGSADFAGGNAPTDGWTDDPLIEAEKQALQAAVGTAFAEMAKFLKLVRK